MEPTEEPDDKIIPNPKDALEFKPVKRSRPNRSGFKYFMVFFFLWFLFSGFHIRFCQSVMSSFSIRATRQKWKNHCFFKKTDVQGYQLSDSQRKVPPGVFVGRNFKENMENAIAASQYAGTWIEDGELGGGWGTSRRRRGRRRAEREI